MPSPVAQPGEPLRRRFAIMEVFVHHSCLSYRKSSLPRLIGARIKDAFGASDPYQLTHYKRAPLFGVGFGCSNNRLQEGAPS